MANDGGEGAAGGNAGGEGGKGAAGGNAGGAQGGASGEGAKDTSLIGGAGLKKEVAAGGEGGKAGSGDGTGDEAAKKDAAARSELEKKFAKDLEGKSDADKKAFLDKKMAEAAATGKKGGAPEKYADFKLPEGSQVDPKAMEGFQAIGKKWDLSQETMQELVDFQAHWEKAHIEAATAEFDRVAKSWREETQKKFGANFEVAQANVGRFLERFGGPVLRKVMDATRIGENAHLFEAMAKAGELLGEGKVPDTSGGGGQKDPQGKRWYPNMRQQLEGAAK